MLLFRRFIFAPLSACIIIISCNNQTTQQPFSQPVIPTPSFVSGYPAIEIDIAPFGFSAVARLESPGSILAVCVPFGDTAPTALEVLNGTRSGGGVPNSKYRIDIANPAHGNISVYLNSLLLTSDAYYITKNLYTSETTAPKKLSYAGVAGTLADVQIWLDAANITSITTDASGNVSQWNDLSGNLRHFQQPTVIKRPAYLSNGFGQYKPGISMTSSTWLYSTVGTAIFNNIPGATIFIVQQVANTWINSAAFYANADATTYKPRIYIRTTGNKFSVGGRRLDADNLSNYSYGDVGGGYPFMATAIYDYTANKLSMWVNTVSVLSLGNFQASAGNTSATSAPTNYIGVDTTFNATDTYTGVISELIVYRRALTAVERAKVEAYLRAKWWL